VTAIILSVAGIAVVAVFIGLVFRTGKREKVWEKLDEPNAVPVTRDVEATAKTARKTNTLSASAVAKALDSPASHQKPPHTGWEDSGYCWVVVCKNHWVHRRYNPFHSHRIPLAQTDAVMPRPKIDGTFPVRCDDCGKEYAYEPSEVLRYEQDLPESFTPHPLFRDEV
jgi:hypothetical protein